MRALGIQPLSGLSAAGSIPTVAKLFAEINFSLRHEAIQKIAILPANFVYYGKTRMANQMWSQKVHYTTFAILFLYVM